jgi:hypothetical protein
VAAQVSGWTRGITGTSGALLGILLLVAACDTPAKEENVAPRKPTSPAKVATTEAMGSAMGSAPVAGAPTTPYQRALSGRIYVPTYSHIYVDEGEAEDLAVTLSIRNVSTERSLVLNVVAYYDTSGKLIEDYLDADVVLGPLETVEYFVRVTDRRGGSGSNFIVSWRGDSPLVKPLTEAVMVRTRTGNQAYAFATRGIEIPDSAALPDHLPPGSYPREPAAKGEDSPGRDSPGEDSPGEDSPGEDSPGEDSPGAGAAAEAEPAPSKP